MILTWEQRLKTIVADVEARKGAYFFRVQENPLGLPTVHEINEYCPIYKSSGGTIKWSYCDRNWGLLTRPVLEKGLKCVYTSHAFFVDALRELEKIEQVA